MTRKGKIARLPQTMREELNQRLFDGESGKRLVAWLNSLPETKCVMAEHFGAREINEPNLSEWKAGGYRDWLAQREVITQTREWMAEVKGLTSVTEGQYGEHLATLLGARYAVVLANWRTEEPTELRRKLRALRSVGEDVSALRKGDQMQRRLTLERDQLRWEKENAAAVNAQNRHFTPTLSPVEAEREEAGRKGEDGGLRMAEGAEKENGEKQTNRRPDASDCAAPQPCGSATCERSRPKPAMPLLPRAEKDRAAEAREEEYRRIFGAVMRQAGLD